MTNHHPPVVRHQLLMLARAALEASVCQRPAPPVPRDIAVYAFGVFVSIHTHGELRGCLGSLDCSDSIPSSIARLASAVTHEDLRFSPLALHELAQTTIDLSLLTIPERVEDHEEIEVGRHGLIVERGRRRGLLLPQVAPEHGWDLETFLSHTCIKAGLPAAAWREGVDLYRFEAEVFGE